MFWLKGKSQEQAEVPGPKDRYLTVIWDEAKIVEQYEKTRRVKIYLAYCLVVAVLGIGSRIIG